MPASRPQQSNNQAKTTAPSSNTNRVILPNSASYGNQEQQQQPLQSVVSSPQSSPTNPHLSQFISQDLSVAQTRESPPSSTNHVIDTASISARSDTICRSDYSSSDINHSVSLSSSTSNNRNIVISGGHARPQHQVQAQYTTQAQVQAQNQEHNSPQIIARNEARVFSQQLQQQQQIQFHQQSQNLNQQINQSDASHRTSWTGIGARSVIGSIMSARGSTAASTVGGTGLILGGGGGSVNGDEPTEQTLLLVRPVWIQDQDAAACRICARTFSTVRRKLGYPKAVRVCNDCFEVAYLVAYCVSDDLGPSTQIHGARGLYELIVTNDEKVIASVLSHGGLDAVIYLCSMVHGYELHSLATTALATLSEHKSTQSMIVAKRAMPKLFHIVSIYTSNTTSHIRPSSPLPALLTRMASTSSVHTKSVRRIESVAIVLMNVTHIVYQMVPDRMLAKQMVQEGAVDTLMNLCVYFPAGARSRAAEEAIRTISVHRNESEDSGLDSGTVESQRGSFDSHHQGSFQGQADKDLDEGDESTLFSLDDELHSRLENMQSIAAKCISVLASDVSNQAFIVDDPERINRLAQLLYSTNLDVVKYASKTMAYLSLRNDKYKPDIAKGSGAGALLAVIRAASSSQMLSGNSVLAEAVSHACCALANLATNTESQEILMSYMDLLIVNCSVVGLFPNQRDIERHVARLIANLALYDQNKLALLTAYNVSSESGMQDRPFSPHFFNHSYHSGVQNRYSSPPPQTRRAKSNVIPTLLHIGSLTLEKANISSDQETGETYPSLGQDVIDFMNDDGQMANRTNPGLLAPVDSVSDMDEAHQSLMGGHAKLIDEDEVSEWATIPGMEDVQRHIIRAIDNLMTSVTEDPTSSQAFKVFSRIWPTIGLIKTIQMASHDEDTQRRATHVLSTLISQQEIHAEAIAALKQKEKASQPEQERLEEEKLEAEKQWGEKLLKEKREKKEKKERKRLAMVRAKEKSLEQERLEQERLEQERLEQERLEQERLEQERLEQERLEQERAEKERLEQKHAENERLEEQERLEQERAEMERLEQKRAENERLEQELAENELIERKRAEEERLEQERVEKERIEKELEEKRLEEQKTELENAQLESEEQEPIEEEEGPNAEGHSGSGTSSKTVSGSEDQPTSQDEGPKPKEKAKKKKKKKSAK
ncbi:hypothetical protein BGX27_000618 [Mortierella sp. AM989]|nr:hypothetical protein BGX27_000618 [Mortierella sp. AM989]